MKKRNTGWLLLIPAVVLVFNYLFVANQRYYYMNWPDPCYAYLLNGTNIAAGKLEVGHIDHPGTTVQAIGGLFIRAIYMVSGKQPTVSQDVIANPEKYLHALFWVLMAINCGVIFWAGRKIYRISNNLPLAIYFQSGVLIFFNALTYMADIKPEPFIITGMIVLTVLCYAFIHEKDLTAKTSRNYAIGFGITGGFLLITKIITAPMLLIPFLLLGNWKHRFLYIGTMIVAGFLFFIPALPKIHYVMLWLEKITFHSGIYGGGSEKMIDGDAFKEGLWNIVSGDITFIVMVGVMLVAMIRLFVLKKFKWKSDASVRLLTGVFLSTLASIVMVGKHFSYHYLIAAYLIAMLGTYLAIRSLIVPGKRLEKVLSKPRIVTTLTAIFILFHIGRDIQYYNWYEALYNPKLETAQVMSRYKNVPRIYVTYEFPFAEQPPGLYFGLCYSGGGRTEYIPALKKFYPQAYFYSYDEKRFHDWEKTIDPVDLIEKYPHLLLSFYMMTPDMMSQTMAAMNLMNDGMHAVEIKKVFENTKTGEQLFEINRKAAGTVSRDSIKVYSCDAENISGGSLVSSDGITFFQGAECRSNQYAHGGKFSLKLDERNQFGFAIHLPVKKGKRYEVSVWRKSETGKGVMSASAGKPEIFQQTSSTPLEETADGWGLLKLRFVIPQDYPEDTITIYSWNENGPQVTYFDDFMIMEY